MAAGSPFIASAKGDLGELVQGGKKEFSYLMAPLNLGIRRGS
jgi:hypothetical protein